MILFLHPFLEVSRFLLIFATLNVQHSMQVIHIDETDSTNRWLRNYSASDKHGWAQTSSIQECPCLSDATIVVADYQTAGRGQGTNTWESERGKNLTFSIGFSPEGIKAAEQFVLSMAISVALVKTLRELSDVSIKWPNDIYVGDKKICGILIENTVTGSHIKDCIIGIGLNVNQTAFVSDAPNPTSMALESGHEWKREEVLQSVLTNFGKLLDNWNAEEIRTTYRQQLYRREGPHPYRDANGLFEATLLYVEDDGHLLLRDVEGHERRYSFKEVAYIL